MGPPPPVAGLQKVPRAEPRDAGDPRQRQEPGGREQPRWDLLNLRPREHAGAGTRAFRPELLGCLPFRACSVSSQPGHPLRYSPPTAFTGPLGTARTPTRVAPGKPPPRACALPTFTRRCVFGGAAPAQTRVCAC